MPRILFTPNAKSWKICRLKRKPLTIATKLLLKKGSIGGDYYTKVEEAKCGMGKILFTCYAIIPLSNVTVIPKPKSLVF